MIEKQRQLSASLAHNVLICNSYDVTAPVKAATMTKNEHLGEFEQLALLAVLRLGDITLTRLESKGLVRSSLEAPGGGRPRRYFQLVPDGVRALKTSRDTLLSMWEGVEQELETA